MSAIKAIAVAACGLLFAQGCAVITPEGGRVHEVRFSDDGPAMAVNIGYVRSGGLSSLGDLMSVPIASPPLPALGWHNPGAQRPGAMQVRCLDVVTRDDPRIFEPQGRGGGLYPFPVPLYAEESGNVLLAPGYNPVSLGYSDSSMAKAIHQANVEFADKYLYDFERHWPNHAVCFSNLGVATPIVWTRLPQVPGSPAKGLTVDHGFLVYLLQEGPLWDDLRGRAGDTTKTQAVRLACQAILDLMKAHDAAWPQFKWNDKQKAVRSWCEKTVITAEKDSSSRP